MRCIFCLFSAPCIDGSLVPTRPLALRCFPVPLLQVAGVGDVLGDLRIEPGGQRCFIDQQVGAANLVFQPFDLGNDLAVVADEVGIEWPFAGHQTIPDHQAAGFGRIDFFVGHAAGGVEHQPVEHTAFVCHGAATVLFPVGIAPGTLDEVLRGRFDPLRLDGGIGAGHQAARIDHFGRHQPAGALLVLRRGLGTGFAALGFGHGTPAIEDGRRMQHEFLLVRALPARPFWQAVGDVAEQAGEQRAVDDIRCRFVFVDVPVQPPDQFGELADHIGPFAQFANGQEFPAHAVGQCAVRFAPLPAGGLLFLPVTPEFQPRQKIGLGHVEAGMCLIRGLLGGGWAFTRILHRQGRGDDQCFVQAAGTVTGQQHAGQARIDRQARQLFADGGEALAVVHGTQLVEQGIAVGNGLGRRLVEKRKGRDFRQAQRIHAQDDGGK